MKDEAGLLWVPGECVCAPALDVAGVFLNITLEGLGRLQDVLCGVMLSTLELFVKTAIEILPPGRAGTAAARVVEGAKTFAENGVAAASLFGDWIGPACKLTDLNWKPFDLNMLFQNMVSSPDSIGVSKGCFKKNKADCSKPKAAPTKKPDPVPSPTKDAKPNPSPSPIKPGPVSSAQPSVSTATARPSTASSGAPATSSRASTTSSSSSTTSSSASACRIGPRQAGSGGSNAALIEGKLGEELKSEDVCNGVTTVHITKTEGKPGSYPTEIPATCSEKWTQACYHYRSVMSVWEKKGKTDMVRWTCYETTGTSVNGRTTATWGSTAIGPIKKGHQHWFPWANGFIYRLKAQDPSANDKGCERDEWPPRYFWPGDKAAERKGLEQRVRFLPAHENGGAGGMWNGFCADNAAQTVLKDGKTYQNPKFIKTVSSTTEIDKLAGGGKTTIITRVSVQTAHAIFTIKSWENLPDDPKWHGLMLNTDCWPKKLAPEDPGWALFTNDEFYLEQHKELQQYTARYQQLPDLQKLIAAMGGPQAAANWKPDWPITSIDQAQYDKVFAKKPIPDEYRAVLPGIPRPPPPPGGAAPAPAPAPAPGPASGPSPGPNPAPAPAPAPSPAPVSKRGGNDTLPDYYGGDDIHDETTRWWAVYMEFLRRQRYSSNIVAPHTDATPTPAGQGRPTATLAMAGSSFVVMPEPTS